MSPDSMDNDVHQMRLKQLGPYKSYNVFYGYRDYGEPSDNHVLHGLF